MLSPKFEDYLAVHRAMSPDMRRETIAFYIETPRTYLASAFRWRHAKQVLKMWHRGYNDPKTRAALSRDLRPGERLDDEHLVLDTAMSIVLASCDGQVTDGLTVEEAFQRCLTAVVFLVNRALAEHAKTWAEVLGVRLVIRPDGDDDVLSTPLIVLRNEEELQWQLPALPRIDVLQ